MGAVTADSVNRQPLGNTQVRIAVLVVLAVVIGVVLWLVLGHKSSHNKPKNRTIGIGPIAFSAKNLAAESRFINTKFYWAGKSKQQGVRYEFTRTTNDRLYVRYLPRGAKIGNKSGQFLVVSTYPFVGGYQALKKQAKHKAMPGPGGSIMIFSRKDHKAVLMAFPGINAQIEVYDPNPTVALNTAQSGKIKPVR
jgi:hypothetical protein